MVPHDSRDAAPLEPAEVELVIRSGPDDVVGPKSEADVGSGRTKVGLVGQVGPAQRFHISGETDLVAVIPKPSKSSQDHTAFMEPCKNVINLLTRSPWLLSVVIRLILRLYFKPLSNEV